MPITSRSFVRWNSFLFAIGLLALVVLIGATFWLIARTSDYADAALTARQVRADIADLKSLVQDAESSQRGFLLTANDSYLGPFELARQEIPSKLDSFRVYVTQEPALAEGMAALSTRINAKLDELSNTVALARAGRTQEALAIVDGGAGQKLMDEARDLFDTLIDGADRRFASSIAAQQDSANALNWVALAATGVILVVVGSAAWIVLNYTRDLASARVEIETLNTGLEEKVRERTVELGRANDEIQRFAYIVTHDLRAPLVNIMGFTSELETSIAPIKELVTGLEEEGREIGEAKLIVAED
ncbi:MAG: CHASE3 domain-containing protein, partial [Rhizobiaceae bacterium]|nr:CHASE3 domain-containing protein [Rhizobiaceae bacterium]